MSRHDQLRGMHIKERGLGAGIYLEERLTDEVTVECMKLSNDTSLRS